MDEQAKRQRRSDFERISHERGQPITAQRRLILEAVLELETHPTAEEVRDAVARRLPGISRTTVYRTLDTLLEMGLVSRVCHPSSVARFDRRTGVHHHLVCLHCGAVADISDDALDSLRIPDTSAQGFEVSDYRVQIRGRCKSCGEKRKEEGR